MINPWCHESNGIVSLSSGVVASAKVQMDLERAYTIGEKQTTDFIEKRLVAKSEEVFLPIRSNKLKTIGTSTKTKSSSSLKKLKADRATYARLVIVA